MMDGKRMRAIALVAAGLTMVQIVVGGMLFASREGGGPTALPGLLLGNLLSALVLVRMALRSQASGGRLIGMLFAVTFGIPVVYLVEATLFDIGIPRDELPPLYLSAFLVGVGGAFIAAAAVGKLRGQGEALRRLPLPASRLALSALAYLLFYFAAGIMAWPFLKSFYETRSMPAVTGVALLQILRGAALSLLVWLLARHEPEGRRPAALSAGLCLSIVGGVAPLLVPNAYLPDAVRHVHLVEVGISNFLFGLVAALLLG